MKPFALLLLTCTLAAAQVDSQKLVIQVGAQAMEKLKSIPEADRAAIIASTSELLKKHVTFRPGGTASTWWNSKNKQIVEWKGLTIRAVYSPAIDQADILNGTTKRYSIHLGSDAHRTWSAVTKKWGLWSTLNSSLFPSTFYVELKNGKWVADNLGRLKQFSPGPGLAVAESKPESEKTELPAGMTRGK